MLKLSRSLTMFSSCILLLLLKPIFCIRWEFVDQTPVSEGFDSLFTKEWFFVDKSEMIGTFFSQPKGSFSYISCPHGFGKTQNLLMIKSFANVELDEDTCKRKALTMSRNYHTFKRLKIFKRSSVIEEHMSKYSVVHLHLNITFRNKPITAENFLQEMREKIRNTVLNDLMWLVKLMDKVIAKQVNVTGVYEFHGSEYSFLKKSLEGLLDEREIKYCLLSFAEIYHNFFKKPVIVLIDDYDYVAHESLTTNTNPIMYYKFINEMIEKVIPSDNNSIVSYGLLTGRTKIPLSIGGLDKKIIQYRFLNMHRFVKYYGFYEDEVQEVYKRYNLSQKEIQRARVLYEGYSLSNGFVKIYNPYSIVQYLEHRKTSPDNFYWCYGEQHMYISAFLKSSLFRQEVAILCDYQPVRYDSLGFYVPNALDTLLALRNTKYAMIGDSHLHLLFSYAFENGLLCYTKERNSYIIPNTEVRALLLIMNDLYQKNKSKSAKIQDT
ncbi:uncharacterized protein LOC135834593 [Planococcus citri]|uniref:uncharacterized protein LOC135834593 n=1 Tax=Planococcus citri TaxID=170843 RepID=UPI0031FA12F6